MQTSFPRLAALAACIPVLLAAGCARGDQGMSDTAGMGATSATATAPGTTMSDGNIVALYDAANLADSSLAAQALPKITNREVRAYATMMMSEHGALRAKGLEMARKPTGALPPWPKAEAPATDPLTPLVEEEKRAIESTARGAAFDSMYIAREITLHQAVLDWATQAEAQAQHQELKGLITSTGPIIRKHLERAQQIAGTLGSATGTKTP